jgi:hypothetical protein
MANWKYGGESFSLPDGISAEQATDQIEAILEDRRITENSRPDTDDSVADEPADQGPIVSKPQERSEEGPLGQILEGIGSGLTRIVQGPLELAGMYSDLKYVSDPVFQAAMREKVKNGEAIPASSNTPMTDLVVDSFDAVREKLILAPTTTTGKISEALTQFARSRLLGGKNG